MSHGVHARFAMTKDVPYETSQIFLFGVSGYLAYYYHQFGLAPWSGDVTFIALGRAYLC